MDIFSSLTCYWAMKKRPTPVFSNMGVRPNFLSCKIPENRACWPYFLFDFIGCRIEKGKVTIIKMLKLPSGAQFPA